jgi:antitoxin Phd
MATWQLQEAKAKLSEVIETATKHGPQTITQRGVETAMVVPIDQWKRMNEKQVALSQSEREKNEAFLKLLQSGPDCDIPVPPRGQLRMRKPVRF